MFPVGTNLRIIKTPWATYAIVAGNVFIYLALTWNTDFILRESVVHNVGFIPASISYLHPTAIPTLVTSMFLHGDLLHLIGNMVFLLVFGRRVESQLGRLNFCAFYLAAGITASMAHALVDPTSPVPVIGASGAISGVLGAFFVYNPRARITLVLEPVLIFFLRRLTIRSPAWIFLLLWFLFQISMALKPEATNVAFWAHVGGFLAGAVLAVSVYSYVPKNRPRH